MSALGKIARSLCLFSLLAGASALAGAAEVCQPSTPAYFHKYFSGKIDGKYAFKMDLTCQDGVLHGSYQYAGKDMPIYLQGQAGPGGSLAMQETAGYGVPSTGSFAGMLDDKHFKGTWQSGDRKKTVSFVAEQTAEIHIGTRRDILAAAVGDYGLESIVGNGGANGMWDTGKTQTGWGSQVSFISNAMRQSEEIKLTRPDKSLLDSLTVRVRPDLATELIVKGKTVLEIPFRETAMQFDIKASTSENASEPLEKLSAATSVLDEKLYLLAQDGVDYSRTISGKFNGVVGDVLVVTYAIVDHRFELTFRTAGCCNESVFTFKRRTPARQGK